MNSIDPVFWISIFGFDHMTFTYILVGTFGIALCSLIGIAFFFFQEQRFRTLVLALVALSAGAMLGNATFHLLPESLEAVEAGLLSLSTVLLLFTVAFVVSFLFELVFYWHHCHTASHHGEANVSFHCHHRVKPYSQLVLVSDAIHNFVDGVVIAAAFVVSPMLGLTTVVAVALHEIPQELGDYAVLVHGGYKKQRALVLNYLSAASVILGGIVGYFVTNAVSLAVPLLLPFAAGSFLYIAASDLLPELKHEEKIGQTLYHALIFLIGLAIMFVTAL